VTARWEVRPAPSRPAPQPTVAEVRAAARILARHHHPDWRPTNDDLDGYGRGYGDGVRQRTRELQACVRCARDAHEKCLDRRDEPSDGDITCGCGCWTRAVTGE
jgi:hypothetical protein